MRVRRRLLILGAAAAACAGVSGQALADHGNATWIGLGGSNSWLNDANWNTNSYPNGAGVGAFFVGLSGGPIVTLGGSTLTLSSLELSDPLYTTLVAGTINLTGPAIINADGNNFDLPEKVIATFGTISLSNNRPGNNIGGTGSLTLSIIGSNGLSKTGDTHLEIDSPQFYTGTTSITGGGKIISTVGDSAFGAAGNAVSLDNGSIQIASTDWGTSITPVTRTVNIGSGGGSIYWIGSTQRNINFNGDFAGGGTLRLNGYFTLSGNSSGIIRSSNSLTGTLNVAGGTVILQDNGAFANSPFIRNSGTLIVDNSNSGASIDRLANNASVTMRGAAMSFKAGAVNYQESIGTTTLDGGLSVITVDPGNSSASINLGTLGDRGITSGSLAANNAAGMFFRGTNLGNALAASVANIYINNGTSLLVGAGFGAPGIIPFAYGNASISATESNATGLVTYGAAGVAPLPLSSYSADFTTATASTYVRIQSNTSINTSVSVNALVLTAPDTLEVTSGGAGIQLSSTGTFVINVNSGVVLNANAGYFDNGGPGVGSVNSSPGNLISARLAFGGKEAIFLTPSALSVSGIISGTGGLTKIGGRTLQLSGNNTYTGKTVLTGFNRFTGNIPDNINTSSDNPYGRDPSAIVLYGGNASPSGTGFGELGANAASPVTFARPLDVRGDQVLLRSFGSSTVMWGSNGTINNGTINNGTITISDPNTVLTFLSSKQNGHQVVNAPITGLGKVVIGATDPNPAVPGDVEETWVDLMNAGTFQGGLVLAGGTIGIGNDNALGSGTVQVTGNTLMTALNAPRTIPNKFVVYGATLGVGTNGAGFNVYPFTLTGEINGRGGDYLVNLGNGSIADQQPSVTFSGPLTGGGLTKTGLGTLTISGNNTFTGVLNVGNGSTAGGMVIIQSDTAIGSTIGPTGVDYGSSGTQNTLEIDGTGLPDRTGITVGNETLYLRGNGVSNLGALYSATGNNVWQGIVRPAATYDNVGLPTLSAPSSKQYGAIGVNAGSTLTINGGVFVADLGGFNGSTTLFLATPANGGAIGMRKAGAGYLYVGSHANLPTEGGTTVYNSSITATGSLDIQGGTIVVLSHTGISTISAGKSIVDVASINFAGTITVPTAALDLMDNAMVIDYSGSSPVATVRSYLKAGFAQTAPLSFGSWTGKGITSSTAALSPNPGETGRTGLGYVEATDVGLTSLLGDPIDGSAIVIRYTYTGDANFDGKVDNQDLALVARNWLANGNSNTWFQGDFNYDGAVNIFDLFQLVRNWQAGVSSPLVLGSPPLGSVMGGAALDATAVPEPTAGSVVLAGITLVLLARQRRRQISIIP